MASPSQTEAKRLALQLRGELQRDSQVLAQRLLAELYGGETVAPSEQEYLGYVRHKLATDPEYPLLLYKQVGQKRFVQTVAQASGVTVTDLMQQAKAAHEDRQLRERMGAAPTPGMAPPNTMGVNALPPEAMAPPAAAPVAPAGMEPMGMGGMADDGMPQVPMLPEIEGVPV